MKDPKRATCKLMWAEPGQRIDRTNAKIEHRAQLVTKLNALQVAESEEIRETTGTLCKGRRGRKN